jgi:acyl carrier protein
MKNNTLQKLKKIFSSILKKKDLKLTLSRANEKKWDSLNHVNIIIAIENEFRIKFNSNEIENMSSLKKIENIIERKIKKK